MSPEEQHWHGFAPQADTGRQARQLIYYTSLGGSVSDVGMSISIGCDRFAHMWRACTVRHRQLFPAGEYWNGSRFATVEAMRLFMIALLPLLTSLPLAAQDAEAQKKFAGTWEAKWKDKVICTVRLKAGAQISGEMKACSINVDANGDLQEPESTEHSDKPPSPILNAKLDGDTLTFEEKDDDDSMKFEMKLIGDGRAELRILDTPVPIKPIHFDRK